MGTRVPWGLLNLDKPGSWTSHDVVAKIRGLTGVRQVGHAGTLDPMATGVLVLGLGQATRLIEYVMGQRKTYLAQITLGTSTDTYDATGTITDEAAVPPLGRQDLEAVLETLRGPIRQTPPMYSALKRAGKPLYRRARRGELIDLAPRPVTIYSFELLDFDGWVLEARITCSSGTYVRSLAHDLGQALGCGGHLSALRRTAVGRFVADSSVTLEAFRAAAEANRWKDLLLPADLAVAHLDSVVFADDQSRRLAQGQFVPAPPSTGEEPRRAYASDGRFLAIVRYDSQRHAWRPLKVFA